MTATVRLLKPSEVAVLVGVTPATVLIWAKAGRLASVASPSGRYLFRADVVRALLARGGST